MVDLTDNHEFQLWAASEEQWEHRSDFETLEQKVWVRDEDAALKDYEPHDGALFLATDTADVYLGDGNSWTLKWNLGGNGDHTTVEGVASETDHVGPMRQGSTHSTAGCGIMFRAQAGLSINSAIIHTDLSGVSTTDFPVVLAHYESGALNPTEVGSTTVTVSGGPERIDLSGLPDIPSDGEYVLARDQSSNGETVPAWRIPDMDWGQSAWDEHTYSRIDFRSGTNIREDGDFGASGYYYYFFDISIGDAHEQVTSPWSHDVDEIYMRPTDPEEEFDDVSQRALWIDTS